MKKIKQMHKKFLSILLVTIMIVNIIPMSLILVNASTGGKTQSDAVAWANSKVGSSLDYDGVYGAQCVDFIKYYYAYLGVSPVVGYGCDYATNSLPSGWSRIKYYSGFVPQPGDIAVWKATTTTLGAKFGHVAVVASGDSSRMTIYEQGAGFGYKVKKNTITYGQYGQLTCLIRPDFVQDTMKTKVSFDNNFVYIKWDAYSGADYYNVRIRRIVGEQEIADEYSIWSIRGLNTSLALPDGKYRIYVEAKYNEGGYKYGDAYITIASKAPLISASVQNGQVNFSWSNYNSDFHHYVLRIYKDKIWSSELKCIDNLNTNSYKVNLADGHYQAYIDVCDSSGNVIAVGNVCTFDINLELKRTSATNNIVFYSWSEHAGAKYYNLRAKRIEGNDWIESDESLWCINKTSATLELNEGNYYVYVEAVTDDGVCKYTDDYITISYKNPKLSAKIEGSRVDFRWTEYSEADHYRLRIYKNKIWTEQVNVYDNITLLEYTTMLEFGNYAAFLEVLDSNNEVIYYSTAIKFTIEQQNGQFFWGSENSTTVIDDKTKTIHGLEEGIYDLEGFVEYSGCELKYNPTAFGFGTGTTVDIVKDGKVVDTYTIVIFGDINGDGYVDSFDVPDVMAFTNYESQYESGSAQEMAADVNGDGYVDELDLFTVDLASTFAYTIKQSR